MSATWEKKSDRGLLLDRGELVWVSEDELILRLWHWINQVLHAHTHHLPRNLVMNPDSRQEGLMRLLERWRDYQAKKLATEGVEFRQYARQAVIWGIIDGHRRSRTYRENVTWESDIDNFTRYQAGAEGEEMAFAHEMIEKLVTDEDPSRYIDLTRVLEKLPRWKRRFLNLLYAKDMGLREIGELAGVTEGRVCQIHKALLKELKRELEDPSKPRDGRKKPPKLKKCFQSHPRQQGVDQKIPS